MGRKLKRNEKRARKKNVCDTTTRKERQNRARERVQERHRIVWREYYDKWCLEYSKTPSTSRNEIFFYIPTMPLSAQIYCHRNIKKKHQSSKWMRENFCVVFKPNDFYRMISHIEICSPFA